MRPPEQEPPPLAGHGNQRQHTPRHNPIQAPRVVGRQQAGERDQPGQWSASGGAQPPVGTEAALASRTRLSTPPESVDAEEAAGPVAAVVEPRRGAVVSGRPGASDRLQQPDDRRDRHHDEQRGEKSVAVRGPG